MAAARRAGRARLLAAGSLLAAVVLILGALGLLDGLQGVVNRLGSGRWQPEQPTGPDHLTARMRAVRAAVAKEFALPYGSGCYREDGGIAGGGEHPLGRACDFMLGPAGVRATGGRQQLGDRIVRWVRDHADEYGIWYVIYRRHIWSSRHPERGWLRMEDRGSITENHYDHVHISVY
ncbi:hypothetical protein ACIQGZ_11735 [Streptomyces sp. NPDC092296]|uniref:hypothetical protein n=1 Tax=Streptomyces sp. NPDC092296 TaxID=3366012 RepID=UPI0038290BC8